MRSSFDRNELLWVLNLTTDIVSQAFSLRSGLMTHISICHPIAKLEATGRKPRPREKDYECNLCDMVSRSDSFTSFLERAHLLAPTVEARVIFIWR